MKEKVKKTKKNRGPHYPRRCLSWAIYLASNGIQVGVIGYLSIYLTDSVALSAAIVGTILAFSRVFDGVSDLIAGLIIDRTKTRWGNARPYSIFSVVMWAAVVALFSVPEIGTVGKIIYVFIMYNLSDTVARTMLVASEPVHFKKGFNDEEQLDTVGTAGLISGIVSMIFNIILPTLVSQLGTTKEGWTLIAIVIAVPSAIMGILKLFFLPEMDLVEVRKAKQEMKVPLKESIRVLFHNPHVFIFNFAVLLMVSVQGMAVYTYFFKYIIGDIGKFAVVGAFAMLSLVVMPLIPVLTRKLGSSRFCTVALIVGGLAELLIYINPQNLILVAIAYTVSTLAIIPLSMLANVLSVQCMRFSEWKDGIKIDGLISSIYGVANKLGRALGAVVVGFMLGMAGYDGTLAVQSDAANSMIIFLFSGLPAILLIISGLFMHFYKLEKQIPQIEADLVQRAGSTEPAAE